MERERGSAVVEFALVLPLLFAVVVSTLELVVVARIQLEVVAAAREGAREAATTTDPARAVAAVKAALPPGAARLANVSVSRPARVGEMATVTVRVRHRFAGALFGGLNITLQSRAVMRTER